MRNQFLSRFVRLPSLFFLLWSTLLPASAKEFPAFTTVEGCRFHIADGYDTFSAPVSQATWTGACKNGYAEGHGVLTYLVHFDGVKRKWEHEGPMTAGLFHGDVTGRYKFVETTEYADEWHTGFGGLFEYGCNSYAGDYDDCRKTYPRPTKKLAKTPSSRAAISPQHIESSSGSIASVSSSGAASRGGGAGEADVNQALQATTRPTELECFNKIVAIHKRGDRERKAVRGDAAMEEAASNRSRRAQLELFSGECAHHSEAAGYVKAAQEQLRQSEALSASSAATGQSLEAAMPRTADVSGGPSTPGSIAGSSSASGINGSGGESSGRKTKLHDRLAEAHDCIRPSVAGLYGGFINSCNETVRFNYCVLKPKKGAWTDSEFYDCERAPSRKKENSGHCCSVGPNNTGAYHTKGGQRVFYFACKNGASPKETYFDGSIMRGKCVHD